MTGRRSLSQQTQEDDMGERPAITIARRKPKRTVRYYAAIAAATVAGYFASHDAGS